jgi:UDP-N-acetyl-D-galactosamine dehydrogenase
MISGGLPRQGLEGQRDGPDLQGKLPGPAQLEGGDIVHELESYGCDVHVYDPVADADEAQHEYGIKLESWEDLPKADALVAPCRTRKCWRARCSRFQAKLNDNGCFIDVKSQFDPKALREAGYCVWRL